jgi:hypothetical protein
VSRGFRVAAWACIVVSALSSMIISYVGLAGLARMVGYGTVELPLISVVLDVSVLLPVAIDVAIVASTLVWLAQGAPRHTLTYARNLALVTIGTSVLANATYHGMTGHGHWWLASLVASIPPAFLAALVHLGALLVRGTPAAPAEVDDVHQEPVTDHQDPVEPTPQAPEARPEAGDAPGDNLATSRDLVEQVARLVDAAESAGLRAPGRGVLARQLDATEHEVRQALAQLRQERAGRLELAPSHG